MANRPQIIVTGDGSHSLLNAELNETYHSIHGALRESQHVFIENGIAFWIAANPGRPAGILEVGFGTGLNALLTLRFSQERLCPVHYTSVEAFPLDAEVWKQLNYAAELKMPKEFEEIHQRNWNEEREMNAFFTLLKKHTTLQLLDVAPGTFDVIYYDAFAPSRQPEMWSVELLSKVVTGLSAGGVFVTYCAKGQLKRDLKSLGLEVETLAGPPGKKEMVRATK